MSSKLTGIWLIAERRNTEEIGKRLLAGLPRTELKHSAEKTIRDVSMQYISSPGLVNLEKLLPQLELFCG